MTAKRALILGILVWALYIFLRSLSQRLMPFTDMTGYVCQDIAITILRLFCMATCFWIASKRWGPKELGLEVLGGNSLWARLAMAALVAGQLGADLSGKINTGSPLWLRGLEIAIAGVVASNEEIGFRVLFFNSIREMKGPVSAVLFSTILFTFMHLGYQPAWSLPRIFLTGLTLALLRDRGIPLKTLILVHFTIDGISAATMSDEQVFGLQQGILIACSALGALLAWRSLSEPSVVEN